MKITPLEYGGTRRLAFLAWGDFHARTRVSLALLMGTTRSLVIHIRGKKPDLNRVETGRVCYDCVVYCWNIVLLIVEGNFLIPVGKVLDNYGFVVAEKSRKFGTA